MATTDDHIASNFSVTLLFLLTSPICFTFHGFTTADQTPTGPVQPPRNCSLSSSSTLSCDIENLKFTASNLELLLEKAELQLYSKSTYIERFEERIKELGYTINQMESDLANVEEAPCDNQMVDAYEDEVKSLEDAVKSNERELQLLKLQTKHAENSVDLLASRVKSMSLIVPELWFHVQKLEQAQEVIERRTAELQRFRRNQKCLFFKSINKIIGLQNQEMVAAYSSEAINRLKRSLLSMKKYHHQLQGFVRQKMGEHDFTAVLAGDESIFFLASVIFVFPIMLAWICMLSHWR